MSRGTAAFVDLDALRHNYALARRLSPDSRVVAVVKANAYGHGVEQVCQALADAEEFAVSVVEEGLALRASGEGRAITVLEGPLGVDDLAAAAEHGLRLAIHAPWQLDMLQAWRGGALRVWVKLDTGMHRLGFDAAGGLRAWEALSRHSEIELLGWMTHLACADETDPAPTRRQFAAFDALIEAHPAPHSVANSAGILAWPQARREQVRAGIMLYGASPFAHRTARDLGLRPVMTLSSRVIAVREVAAGEAVGYGATFRCPEAMPVGIVAIGYGDGYPRHAPSGTPVLVKGRRARLAGRVSMDMLALDLRGVGGVRPGDPVVLWGDGLPCDEIARAAGTIAYELFCGVTARVPRIYRGVG